MCRGIKNKEKIIESNYKHSVKRGYGEESNYQFIDEFCKSKKIVES